VTGTDPGTGRYGGREFTVAELHVVRALAASLPSRAAIAEVGLPAAGLAAHRRDNQGD